MWSEDKNCEVSADLPTPEAPNMATLYCSGGVLAAGPVMLTLEARREEREARDARRELLAEQAGEKSLGVPVRELLSPELFLRSALQGTLRK